MPAITGFQREHPLIERRKGLAFGDPNRQSDFGQFARIFEFIHVARNIRIALSVQRRWAQGKGELAVIATNYLVEHEMQLLAMRAFVIEKQIDDVRSVR